MISRRTLLQLLSASTLGSLISRPVLAYQLAQVPPDFLSSVLVEAQSTIKLGAFPKVEVASEYVLDNFLLYTEELLLHPNSRMRLAGTLGKLGQKMIIAKKIVVLGKSEADAPTISWVRSGPERRIPVPVGKAHPGESGVTHNGRAGENGITGNIGFSGAKSASLIIVCREYVGGPVKVELQGLEGGQGGDGQMGGDGGAGRPGRVGKTRWFDCGKQPTDGGNGGDGGSGGPGGQGGQGGDGGTLVVIRPVSAPVAIELQFKPQLAGGVGGRGGEGGIGGEHGRGGAPGEIDGYCQQPAKAGLPGKRGANGPQGLKGDSGLSGDFRVGLLNSENSASAGLN